jgi:hypothetical protein
MNEQKVLRWVEMVSVVVIVAAVGAMAVPKRGEIARSGDAERLLADVEVVREAVYRFYSDSAYFPAQVPGRQVPDGLVPYLPPGFAFRRPYGTLDYRNWPMAVRDTTAGASNVVGVTVTVNDPRVGASARARADDAARFVLGNKFTFLFFGS